MSTSIAMKRWAFGLTAASLLACTATAQAGIIILKNGKVFIGRIDAEDVTDDTIVMHGPRRHRNDPRVPDRQKLSFPRRGGLDSVRWYDASAQVEEPTDEYFKQFEDEELDPRYQDYIRRWKERKENVPALSGLDILPTTTNLGSLSPITIPKKWGHDEISIRKPANWSSNVGPQDDFLLFLSDQKGADGWRPRIRVFSCESAIGTVSDKLEWVKTELQKLAVTPDAFEVRGDNTAPRPAKGGGYDVEWTTATRRQVEGKVVTFMALRRIHFREHRTYFVSCYAHEKDFSQLRALFTACMSSLQIHEGGGSTKAADQVDTASVGVGQVYRWKSASVADQLVWEITAKETLTIRHKTIVTTADGAKKTTEQNEQIGPVDPVVRLSTIVGAPANPQRLGKETIAVSDQQFECEKYECSANGKKYCLWVSKKFPVEIKLTIDGQVDRELAEIKAAPK